MSSGFARLALLFMIERWFLAPQAKVPPAEMFAIVGLTFAGGPLLMWVGCGSSVTLSYKMYCQIMAGSYEPTAKSVGGVILHVH